MGEASAASAQSYRDQLRAKAERLGGGEDARSVDASDYTPPEKLYAGVKTGMRPVSRQARKRGGKVVPQGGELMPLEAHALKRPGRAARKAGGGVGESYVNRDSKSADEDREGHYPNGGMNKGGRAHRDGGGSAPSRPKGGAPFSGTLPSSGSGPVKMPPSTAQPELLKKGGRAHHARGGPPKTTKIRGFRSSKDFDRATRDWEERMKGVENPFEAEQRGAKSPSVFSDPGDDDSGMKKGGRAKRAIGGYLPREGGPTATRALKTKTGSSAVDTSDRPASEDGRLGRASGGRAARQAGGPLATPLAAGMGGQGRFNFNYGPQQSEATKLGLKDGGRAKAHERYGHGPSCNCSDCRKGKAGGGGLGMLGGLLPVAIEEMSGGDKDDDNKPAYAPGTPGNTGGKKRGGRARRANGGAAPGPCENEAAVGQPSLKRRAPHGENSIRARTLAAAKKDGGIAEGALKQHRLEHKALGKAKGGRADGGAAPRYQVYNHKTGETIGTYNNRTRARNMVDRKDDEYGGYAHSIRELGTGQKVLATGGRAAHAHGGKSGKGTKINIIIAPGGANPQGPGDPSQNPALAIKPPVPPPGGMPMPMPAPGAGAPAAMPMPIPMAGPAGPPGPPGMPPRARGGRAPKIHGETEAGAGSGLGRLQKTAEYGHRSREGEGLRK